MPKDQRILCFKSKALKCNKKNKEKPKAKELTTIKNKICKICALVKFKGFGCLEPIKRKFSNLIVEHFNNSFLILFNCFATVTKYSLFFTIIKFKSNPIKKTKARSPARKGSTIFIDFSK